jgi:hypothetical protein
MKYLFTFGVGTKYKGKCVIVNANDEILARQYVYRKYGQQNIAGVYNYEQYKHLIEKCNYKIIKEVIL